MTKKPGQTGQSRARAKPKRASKPRRNGQKPKHTKAAVIEAIQQAKGFKTYAAKLLKVSRSTLYTYLDRWPDLKDVFAELDEETGDRAELELVKAIEGGQGWAVQFYLRTKGKERGYVERVEATGKNGGPIETRPAADLSGYTEEELEILRKHARSRESEAREG